MAEIEIGKVEESELERRFKAALQSWTTNVDDESTSITGVPDSCRYRALGLRLEVLDDEGRPIRARYRIGERQWLGTRPSVSPDSLIERMSDRGRKIAVFLDVFQFHGSTDLDYISADAAKRWRLRSKYHLVWKLTWLM